MLKNKLKAKLKKGVQTFGGWITMAHPSIPELMGIAGFDWVAIDMEHSAIDLSDLTALIISAEAFGLTPLVRIGELNPNLIKRVMDAGAYGIIAANVNSRKDAELVVNAVKYPPYGKRGVGLSRAQKYGEGFSDYVKWVQTEPLIVVQIEHIDAVRNIESIFSTHGIDAYILGPYDLSGSMGRPGHFSFPEFKQATKAVLQAAKRHGIVPGFHSVSSDYKLALMRRREGYRLLAFGTDFMFLKDSARSALLKLKKTKK